MIKEQLDRRKCKDKNEGHAQGKSRATGLFFFNGGYSIKKKTKFCMEYGPHGEHRKCFYLGDT